MEPLKPAIITGININRRCIERDQASLDELALLADTTSDLIHQIFARLDAGSNVGQQGHLSLETREDAAHSPPDPEGAVNVEEIRRLEDGSPLGVLCQLPNVMHPAQRDAAVGIEQMAGFSGLLQPVLHLDKHG